MICLDRPSSGACSFMAAAVQLKTTGERKRRQPDGRPLPGRDRAVRSPCIGMLPRQDCAWAGCQLGPRTMSRSMEEALMSSTRVFASPLFVGFDQLEQMLERASKSPADGYPPYNIEQMSSTTLRITLAVAGFTMDDLQITQEDNQLVIRGRQTDDTQGRIFLHRGIARASVPTCLHHGRGDRGQRRLVGQRALAYRVVAAANRRPA